MKFVNTTFDMPKDRLLSLLSDNDYVSEKVKFFEDNRYPRVSVKEKGKRIKIGCEIMGGAKKDNAFLEGTHLFGRIRDNGESLTLKGVILTAPIYHTILLIFMAIFIGYSIGTSPVIGYHLGAENYPELKSLLKKSFAIIAFCSVAMLGLGFALAKPLSMLFVGKQPALYELTVHGFYIFAVSFLFVGFAIFFSGFFTALNDGLTSAIISFLRTLVFQIAAVMLLPLIWGIDGIWWSIVVAELMAAVVGLIFLVIKRKKYQYF